jgi:site-specific DNA-methyltransferase (adenine-specific)
MSWTKYINTIVKADCLDIMRKMPVEAVDIVITDAPYGKDIAKTGTLAIKGSSDKKNEFIPSDWDKKPCEKYFKEMYRVSKNQIIFGGNYFTDYLWPSSCWLVWYKKE